MDNQISQQFLITTLYIRSSEQMKLVDTRSRWLNMAAIELFPSLGWNEMQFKLTVTGYMYYNHHDSQLHLDDLP